MDDRLKNFFYPSSICVVGASSKEKSIGYELLKCMLSYGYTGKIFPVNPKSKKILDLDCYKTIEDIADKIDLAIIVVPKQFVEQSVDSLLEKKVKSIILITAGFRETNKAGEDLENIIVKKISSSGCRLVGPNCMGVISAIDSIKLNATFVAEKPLCGKTAFLSQSGALGAAVLNSLRETDIKFGHFISVGNKADVNENSFLKFWQNDENINVVTFYLESFVNGFEFSKRVRLGEITKPVIVLKAGNSEGGMKAASSHTGALSSKDAIVDSVLKQSGVLRVSNLNELFNTAKGFENFPQPKGNRVAVITNAGGPAILAVDALEKENLILAQLTERTKALLRDIVHPEGSVNNPVDLLPGAIDEVYKKVNEIVLQDNNVDCVISIFVEPVMVAPFTVVESVNSIVSEKPIFQVVMPLPEFWSQYRENSKFNNPLFKNPEDPAEIISNMLNFYNSLKRNKHNKDNFIKLLNSKNSKTMNFPRGFLSQKEAQNLICQYDIPAPEEEILVFEDLDSYKGSFPVVIKGINKEVIHKSEFNAVELNVGDLSELKQKAIKIKSEFNDRSLNVEGFIIQPFIKTKHEILIGGYRDASFGPIIMFGSGGKYVEVMNDVAVKSAYLSDHDIDDMISSTKIGKILLGVRGENPSNVENIKNIIRNSALMLIENDGILEFDFNPIIVSVKNSIHAVDVRIKY